MRLEITGEEMALLLEELNDRRGTIRQEVYHSTTYEFTEQLKRKEAILKGSRTAEMIIDRNGHLV